MPVTWSAVVQLFLKALRAADRVLVPLQAAFFGFFSVPSFGVGGLRAVVRPGHGRALPKAAVSLGT